MRKGQGRAMSEQAGSVTDTSTVNELKELFGRAAAVAAVVPEHLQVAAFNKALDEILRDSRAEPERLPRRVRGRVSRAPNKTRRPKTDELPPPGGPAARARKRVGGGPQTAIEEMIADGYFD